MLKRKDKPEVQEDEYEKYSRDKDQTTYIWLMFGLAIFFLGGLFTLEFMHTNDHPPLFFSSEIIHICVNSIIVGFVGLGGFLWGRQQGMQSALLKMAGQNGGGNGKPTNNKEEQK